MRAVKLKRRWRPFKLQNLYWCLVNPRYQNMYLNRENKKGYRQKHPNQSKLREMVQILKLHINIGFKKNIQTPNNFERARGLLLLNVLQPYRL